MPVRPAARKPGGVTLFGTRLTYRQAAIGAGALLLIVVLLVVLAVKAFGGGGSGTTAGTGPTKKPSAATTTAAATATTATTAPTSAAPTTQPSSAAATSAAPSTPASTGGGSVTLPAGWRWYSLATSGDNPGFTVPLPPGAVTDPQGSEIHVRYNNRLLIIDRSNQPKADPVQDWKDQAAQRSYRDYHLIRIVPVDYFQAGADWEFTYTTDHGNAQHADKRNVVFNDRAAYSLSWYTTPEDWAASQTDLRVIYQGFQPKP